MVTLTIYDKKRTVELITDILKWFWKNVQRKNTNSLFPTIITIQKDQTSQLSALGTRDKKNKKKYKFLTVFYSGDDESITLY